MAIELKVPPSRFLRFISSAMVFTQSAIVVTGASVRLTGSGLGCSTWPECTPGSYTPTPDQPEAPLHAWIEFGNRLLTFVLFINALLLMLAILKNGNSKEVKSRWILLGAIQIIGILAQGVLGGITVLTGLNPATVAAHFLLSILLIAAALSLRQRIHGRVPTSHSLKPLSKRLARLHLIFTILVIAAGTIVTGSGPHAGDSAAERFNLDARTMSWIHADLVIALLGITLALLIALNLSEVPETKAEMGRSVQLFLVVSLAQGALGYIQYFTGLPELIVGFHIFGAIIVWLSAWNIAIKGNVLSRS